MSPDRPTEIGIAKGSESFGVLVNAVTEYAIYLLEPDGTVASWNRGAERLKGYREDEIVGRNFARFFTPEDVAAGKPAAALATASRLGHWEDEAWRVRKDGSRFWALAVLDAIRDQEGRLIGFAKVTRDMTERRLAQQAIAESERRFRLLVNSVVDYALYTLDLNGIIESWNPGAERLKGYRFEEIVGRHFSIFYTEEAKAAGEPARVLNTVMAEGKFEGEGWRVRKDGSRFWANIVIDPIRDDDGRLIGFTKITRDVTERRSLEEAKDQLHQAQKMEAIGHLTGGVAHDFNNLLTAVSGSLSLLQQMIDDPRALKFVETAQKAVTRGAKLTSELLAFSRQHRLQPQTSNANELIAAFEALLRHAVGTRVQIALDLEPRLSLAAIDQNQFHSALLNLVVNARDAMEARGGTIAIETRNCDLDASRAKAITDIEPGRYVMIAVKDTGTGMTAETRARAIEPFFTTKDVGKGSGLGLSQVFGFARQSNGQIEIDSIVGEGSTIRIFLPCLAEAESDKDADSARRIGSVLVTDDDTDVLTIAVETLRTLGYEVYSAAGAEDALAILRRDVKIDVLFTDIVMPHGINGIELAREARRLRPDIRILLCSGYSRATPHAGDPAEFIQKPYKFDELSRRLEMLVTPALAAPRR